MRTWVLSTLMCIPHFAIYIAQCTVKYELACNGRSWVEQSSNSFVPSTTLSCCSPLRAYCLDLMLLNRIVLRTYCVLSFVVCMFVSVRLCMYDYLRGSVCMHVYLCARKVLMSSLRHQGATQELCPVWLKQMRLVCLLQIVGSSSHMSLLSVNQTSLSEEIPLGS